MSELKLSVGRKVGNREGGVTYDGRGRWRVRIMVDNKRLSLGSFRSKEEAEQVYKNAYESKKNEALGFLRG